MRRATFGPHSLPSPRPGKADDLRVIRWSARNTILVLIVTLFAVLAGLYAITRIPLDAIPDLSDTQVIVYKEYPGQAPQVVEDQLTYPISTAMLSVPRSRGGRGFWFSASRSST